MQPIPSMLNDFFTLQFVSEVSNSSIGNISSSIRLFWRQKRINASLQPDLPCCALVVGPPVVHEGEDAGLPVVAHRLARH